MNRRDLLKMTGVAGSLIGSKALGASDPLVVMNEKTLIPFLNEKGRKAARNVVRNTLMQHQDLGGKRRVEACKYIAQRFYAPERTPTPLGTLVTDHARVPLSFVHEWAKMLNTFADQGWAASLQPIGVVPLADATNPIYRIFNTAEMGKPTPMDYRPKMVVLSFVFFKEPKLSDMTPDEFNEFFGMDLSQREGEVPAIKEISDFRWQR